MNKKHKLKKPVSILLTILMLLTVMAAAPVSVSADTNTQYIDTTNTYQITVDGSNNATITAYRGNDTPATVSIPSTLLCNDFEGVTLPVVAIGDNAFYNKPSLQSVTIPSGVTSIGGAAFALCSSLSSVTIPSSVTSIGTAAFAECTGLTSFTIPDTVTSVGSSAFSGCTGLTSVTLGSGISAISEQMFCRCSSLESITIPNTITSIGAQAFDSSGLTSVTIPDSVVTITHHAFQNCASLESVTIPRTTNIGSSAFKDCNANLTIYGYIPSDAKTYATDNNINFVNIGSDFGYTLDANNLATITAYYGTATEISIPSTIDGYTVTAIGSGIFMNTSITAVTIPNTVTSIGSNAFYQCRSLASITMGTGVQTVGNSVFDSCTGLRSIIIPDSVITIGDCAFSSCYNLSNVTMGTGVQTIGYSAFQNCYGLSSLVIPDSVQSIGSSAFSGCNSVSSLTVPGNGQFNYSTLPPNIRNLTVTGNAINANTFPYSGQTAAALNSITIADSVVSIGNNAFYNNTSFTGVRSLTIGNSVVSIGNNAFKGFNSINTITIPNSVVSIGDNAFGDGFSLSRVYIPRSVTTISDSAFSKPFGNKPTIYGYQNSNAETYAFTQSIPFVPILSSHTDSGYSEAPLDGTQTVEDDGNSFGLNKSTYLNNELLGVQLKTTSDTNDMRFVAVLNEGIVSEANKADGEIIDYGFVIAKCNSTSTAQATDAKIKTVVKGAANTTCLGCKGTSNNICGDYGVNDDSSTKYKYVTMAIKDVPESQGFVVRFYVQTASGKVYYANYNTSYTGCVTSYANVAANVN